MVGAAIGSAVAGIGGMIGGYEEGKKADRDSKRALAMGQKQMDFNQEQLDAWEAQFGSMEQNMTDYYNNLDPTKFATQNKENLTMQMDKQLNQFNESMAAQGMQTSGMRAQAEKEAAFNKATGNAAIDIAAPEMVNQMKQGYLGSKENRRTNSVVGMNNAMNNQQQQYSNQAQQHGQSQSGYYGASGNLLGSAIGLGINANSGSSDMYNSDNYDMTRAQANEFNSYE